MRLSLFASRFGRSRRAVELFFELGLEVAVTATFGHPAPVKKLHFVGSRPPFLSQSISGSWSGPAASLWMRLSLFIQWFGAFAERWNILSWHRAVTAALDIRREKASISAPSGRRSCQPSRSWLLRDRGFTLGSSLLASKALPLGNSLPAKHPAGEKGAAIIIISRVGNTNKHWSLFSWQFLIRD